MRDLSKDEVLNALASAQFAGAFFLYLDVLVTVDYGRIGINESEKARSELQRFLKSMGSWLGERKLPVAWIANLERAAGGNLHAHIAVHVPGMRRAEGTLHGVRYRTHFRRWAREAVARQIGAAVPKAVNVRCSLVPSVISHWISVTYLLKGYDRAAVLVGKRNSRDGCELLLGDILPFPYRNVGDVGFDRRLFISGNLGPARRRLGAPSGAEFMLPVKPDIGAIQLLPGNCASRSTVPMMRQPRPFRAAVEDGQFDVRRIYGSEFAQFVTRIKPPVPAALSDAPSSYNPDLLTLLRDLEV